MTTKLQVNSFAKLMPTFVAFPLFFDVWWTIYTSRPLNYQAAKCAGLCNAKKVATIASCTSLQKISTHNVSVHQNLIVKENTEKCSLGFGSAASSWDIAVLCTAPVTNSLSWQVINQKLQASSSSQTTRVFQFMLPVARPTWASKCVGMLYNLSLFRSRAKSSHFFFPAKHFHLCCQCVSKENKTSALPPATTLMVQTFPRPLISTVNFITRGNKAEKVPWA